MALPYLTLSVKAGSPPVTAPQSDRWQLRILHTSDQEAGKKALLDIAGMVAVMDHLDQLPYTNTLKLTSGDLMIAGPFMSASEVLYSDENAYASLPADKRSMEPLAQLQGIADVIINNALGWHAAVIGNHEFDTMQLKDGMIQKGSFFQIIGAMPQLANYNGSGKGSDAKNYTQAGAGIGASGYPGAQFPYLSANIDFDSFVVSTEAGGQSVFKAYGLTDATDGPHLATPATLARSTIVPVGNGKVGVIGVTTPFLPDIVGTLSQASMLSHSYRPKESSAEEQARVLLPLIKKEVTALAKQGIDKVILMTHLQESEIEEALCQELLHRGVAVDIVIGGGSHKLMGPADADGRGWLRGLDQASVIDKLAKERNMVVPALTPYPKSWDSAENRILYVNGGSNYEYLNQLVVTFDRNGKLVGEPTDSRPWRTDGDGVSDMLGHPEWKQLTPEQQNDNIKKHILATTSNPAYRNAIDTLNAVSGHINGLDRVQYGYTTKWLNGIRDDMRSRETNLGNLVADAMLWYGQILHQGNPNLSRIKTVDVAFVNGGGIRDTIGTAQIMPDEKYHFSPPEANPVLGKEQGEISKLDIVNSLRFDNTLTMGTITIEQLKRSAEQMVAKERHGGFGQISGFRFSYDPKAPVGDRVIDLWLTQPVRRQDDRVDGNVQIQADVRQLIRDRRVLRPQEQLGIVTITYLAEGGDGQAAADLTRNILTPYWIGVRGDIRKWANTNQPELITAAMAPERITAGLEARELGFGSYRDALAAYLQANHPSAADNPLRVADQTEDPGLRPSRIIDLSRQTKS